jgi:hypothetical protein
MTNTIVALKVNYMPGYANGPDFQVLYDKIDMSALRYVYQDGLFYAEDNDLADFLGWRWPEEEAKHGRTVTRRNQGGFYGNGWDITLTDGQVVHVEGPWSSRAGEVNAFGLGPCLNCTNTDEPDVFWKRGFTFSAGAVPLKSILRVLPELCPEVTLTKVGFIGDVYYDATLCGLLKYGDDSNPPHYRLEIVHQGTLQALPRPLEPFYQNILQIYREIGVDAHLRLPVWYMRSAV